MESIPPAIVNPSAIVAARRLVRGTIRRFKV
jgi:hypothetical protein